MEIDILPGDIFLVDSTRTGAKIVKFFMTAPTWVHHLWRKMRGTQENVLYYHAGMFIMHEQIIEQQGKVVQKSSRKILSTHNRVFIARVKDIEMNDRMKLIEEAWDDLDKGYDVINCFGKFLTWLTGLKFFARYMEYPDQEICINRIAQWYKNGIGMTFGALTHSELTTHAIYKYIKANPEVFEIVYEGVPNES
jgi:hypothetical protein